MRKSRSSSSTISHPERVNVHPGSWTDTRITLYRMDMRDTIGPEMTESDADAGFMPDENSSRRHRTRKC